MPFMSFERIDFLFCRILIAPVFFDAESQRVKKYV